MTLAWHIMTFPWHLMTLHDFYDFYDLSWIFITFHDTFMTKWLFMTFNDNSMTFNGTSLTLHDFYDLSWLFITFQWLFITFQWLFMTIHETSMTLHDFLWHFMTYHAIIGFTYHIMTFLDLYWYLDSRAYILDLCIQEFLFREISLPFM